MAVSVANCPLAAGGFVGDVRASTRPNWQRVTKCRGVAILSPELLRTLAAVVRAGSFAAAARQLGYTGSAVSQQMAALERHLHARLFERDANGIRPTAFADYIVERSRRSLDALESLEFDLELYRAGRLGRLRLGSFPTASERLLPAALSAFTSSNPGVDVHLDEAEPGRLLELLVSREIDAALVYRYSHAPRRWPDELVAEVVLREDLLVAHRPQLRLASELAALKDLAEETWIATGYNSDAYAVLLHLATAQDFEPRVAYRSDNYGVIQGLVRAGLGVGLVPALGLREDPLVAATPVAATTAFRETLLVSREGPAEVVTAFARSVRRAARVVADSSPFLRYMTRD